MSFEMKRRKIDGLVELLPTVFQDERGYFVESFHEESLKKIGFEKRFVQDNESKSVKGVLRGLHYQREFAQGKLVRCVLGQVLDVAVDLRRDSETFLEWDSVVLDSARKNMFYVPEGFAHGFLVLSDEAIFSYKCTNYYAPEFEEGILWNDARLKIDWQLEKWGIERVILSEKDLNLPSLGDIGYER